MQLARETEPSQERLTERHRMNSVARFLVSVAVLWIAPGLAIAQSGCVTDQTGKVLCGPPDSTCAANQRGDVVCTSPGGGMMSDPHGEQLCGPDYCVRDQRGNVCCSSPPRGGAAVA